MQNNSYEEYIRSVLGYPITAQNDYYQDYNYNRNSELEDYYPEIYNVVYPMVKKTCQNINRPLTREEVDRIVDELYFNLEGNIENRTSDVQNNKKQITQEVRTYNGKKIVAEPVRDVTKETNETRSFRPKNCAMCDLIKILLLREIIGEPGRPPYSPGFQNRPPFPPPGRPPYRPF